MKREPVRLDWTDGNDIRLLQNGADFFPSLCAAIDAATVSVHLETYIFMLDRSGEMVLRCLAEAALRGVKVRWCWTVSAAPPPPTRSESGSRTLAPNAASSGPSRAGSPS